MSGHTAAEWAEWKIAQALCDLPAVNEAIRDFVTEQTGDNATMIVREVIRAISAVPSQAIKAVPAAVFEGRVDHGDHQSPLIKVTGNLRAGDELFVRPPSPAAQVAQWDTNATQRLRNIVALLGMESVVPDGDLTGYEFTVLGMVRMEIERLKAVQQDTNTKLQRISTAVTGSINTAFDEVLNCINLLVEEDTDKYCQVVSNYKKFCILRDQRRAGEEAPEFTELEAFKAATRA